MILNETVAKIADAIREKTGKSELIKPVDFAEEIKGISVGGDAPSGGNQVVYLNIVPFKDVAGDMLDGLLKMMPGLLAVKVIKDWTTICPLAALHESYISDISYIAILSDFRGYIEQSNDVNSSFIIANLIERGAVEITEAEFYNLNA